MDHHASCTIPTPIRLWHRRLPTMCIISLMVLGLISGPEAMAAEVAYPAAITSVDHVAVAGANPAAVVNGKVLIGGGNIKAAGGIVANGNVGLGVAAPAAKLHLAGASGMIFQMDNASDANRGGRMVVSGTSGSGTVALNSTHGGYGLTFGINSVEVMRIAANGNVGIGTTTPSAKFHVQGLGVFSGIRTSYQVGDSVLPNLGAPAWYKLGRFTGGVTGQTCEITWIAGLGYNGVSSQHAKTVLQIRSGNGHSANTNASAHYYTVGYTVPIHSIKLVSVNGVETGTVWDVYAMVGLYVGDHSTEVRCSPLASFAWNIQTASDPGPASLTIVAATHKFIANGVMTVDGQTGNVGIGNLSPAAKLDVNGMVLASNVTMIRTTQASGAEAVRGDDPRLATAATIGTGSMELGSSGSGNRAAAIDFHTDNTYTDFGLRIGRANTGPNSNAEITNRGSGSVVLQASDAGTVGIATNGARRLTVSSNGNVGIGTTTPQSSLAVNGTVTAKEIIVTPNNWSDSIFDQPHSLNDLDAVAEHIKKHRHLPGMPSEAQVIADGVSTGDQFARQLAQIEMLTLHAIDLKRERDRLSAENTAMIARQQASDAQMADLRQRCSATHKLVVELSARLTRLEGVKP